MAQPVLDCDDGDCDAAMARWAAAFQAWVNGSFPDCERIIAAMPYHWVNLGNGTGMRAQGGKELPKARAAWEAIGRAVVNRTRPHPAPRPACPEGYSPHASGFWANTDPCNGTFAGCAKDTENATVGACAGKCTHTPDCIAFDLYLGDGARGNISNRACYIFHETAAAVPFAFSQDCLTCTKVKAAPTPMSIATVYTAN